MPAAAARHSLLNLRPDISDVLMDSRRFRQPGCQFPCTTCLCGRRAALRLVAGFIFGRDLALRAASLTTGRAGLRRAVDAGGFDFFPTLEALADGRGRLFATALAAPGFAGSLAAAFPAAGLPVLRAGVAAD